MINRFSSRRQPLDGKIRVVCNSEIDQRDASTAKAGVAGYQDGRKTCFMGSANESITAWRLNYELVWEDDSREAVQWVQEEFDVLWSHPRMRFR